MDPRTPYSPYSEVSLRDHVRRLSHRADHASRRPPAPTKRLLEAIRARSRG